MKFLDIRPFATEWAEMDPAHRRAAHHDEIQSLVHRVSELWLFEWNAIRCGADVNWTDVSSSMASMRFHWTGPELLERYSFTAVSLMAKSPQPLLSTWTLEAIMCDVPSFGGGTYTWISIVRNYVRACEIFGKEWVHTSVDLQESIDTWNIRQVRRLVRGIDSFETLVRGELTRVILPDCVPICEGYIGPTFVILRDILESWPHPRRTSMQALWETIRKHLGGLLGDWTKIE